MFDLNMVPEASCKMLEPMWMDLGPSCNIDGLYDVVGIIEFLFSIVQIR